MQKVSHYMLISHYDLTITKVQVFCLNFVFVSLGTLTC